MLVWLVYYLVAPFWGWQVFLWICSEWFFQLFFVAYVAVVKFFSVLFRYYTILFVLIILIVRKLNCTCNLQKTVSVLTSLNQTFSSHFVRTLWIKVFNFIKLGFLRRLTIEKRPSIWTTTCSSSGMSAEMFRLS